MAFNYYFPIKNKVIDVCVSEIKFCVLNGCIKKNGTGERVQGLKDGGRCGPAANDQHSGRAPGSHQAQPGRAHLREDEQ